MAVTVGSNVASLRAQRSLGEAGSTLESVFERLSSGQRINKASDDAAGLAISGSLRKDVRVYTQALRNVNDGLSALNIEQGALSELTTIAIRQKELATQSANGTYSFIQRRAMNTEANALVDEFNRIVESSEFNGIHLTDKSLSELRVQCGYGIDGSISFEISEALSRTVGTGTFQEEVTYLSKYQAKSVALGDLDGDGILDMVSADYEVNSNRVYIGKGNGTFEIAADYEVGSSPVAVQLGDVDGDGVLDMLTLSDSSCVRLGVGDGTFGVSSALPVSGSGLALGDVNNDGLLDVVSADESSGAAMVALGKGDGGFFAASSFDAGAGSCSVALGDINGDGALDIVVADKSAHTVGALLGNGDGSFSAERAFAAGSEPCVVALDDLNGDGVLDIAAVDSGANKAYVFMGNGDGGFAAKMSYEVGSDPQGLALGDLNGDGVADLVATSYGLDDISVLIGNGDGTFFTGESCDGNGMLAGVTLGDLNGDGALDIVAADYGDNYIDVLLADTHKVTTAARLNICTREGALQALGTLDVTLQRISAELGAIGSTQSRLGVALNVLTVSRENLSAAEGRISDADVAEESSRLVRTRILQQAGAAVLGQANQQPALALQLLEGIQQQP